MAADEDVQSVGTFTFTDGELEALLVSGPPPPAKGKSGERTRSIAMGPAVAAAAQTTVAAAATDIIKCAVCDEPRHGKNKRCKTHKKAADAIAHEAQAARKKPGGEKSNLWISYKEIFIDGSDEVKQNLVVLDYCHAFPEGSQKQGKKRKRRAAPGPPQIRGPRRDPDGRERRDA